MLEPTAKTDMVDGKPTDIPPTNSESLTSLNYECSSMSSAYASIETTSTNLDNRLHDEDYFPKSDTSSSIDTYWGLPAASSLLIDEEDKIDALNHSREKMSVSQSMTFNGSKDLNTTDKNYKSLPLEDSKNMDKTLEKVEEDKAEPGELKKELSSSDLFKLKDVEGEEDLISVDLKENAAEKSDQLPEMSIPKSKSTTMAFIESIFSSKNPETESKVAPKEEETQSKEDFKKNKQTLVSSLTKAATSASSPNPECSPYKFLLNEYSAKSTEEVSVSSLKLGASNIENLAGLNRKEVEKHDPILSGAASSSKSKTSNKEEAKKQLKQAPSKSVANLPARETDESKLHNLPASSREFTMDLNFNLASAAAASAGAPVVVVDNSSKSPVAKEHDKFTSNASTSSIHNDLKMILEESKDGQKKSSKDKSKQAKSNKSVDGGKKEKPKPQRTKKDKNTSKGDISNSSFNSSNVEQITADTSNLSPTSKTNNLNLIKMMMLMVDKDQTSKADKSLNKKHERVTKEPSIIDLVKQDGRYKYNKEFLMQIREQRASFIDQILPDIFKAYCYCMNGKYWDPEKYFDIVQFPGEFDRIPSGRNTYNRSGGSYMKSNSKYNNKKFTPNSTFNNHNNSGMSQGVTPTAVPHRMLDDSPQPLQVPKNSPKFDNIKKQTPQSILESLGLNTDHLSGSSKVDANKVLLGLIKNEKISGKSSNLMNILNKKSTQSPNILNNLFNQNKQMSKKATTEASSHKHYPQILTAQELEMSQLNQQKFSKHKLPNGLSSKLEDIESNDSFAYKQLVKNLSNHPLASATSLVSNKLEASLAKLQSKQQMDSSKPSWQVSNDGTNILKQMLNLKTAEQKNRPKQNKKHHDRSNMSPHLSMSHGSESSSVGSSPSGSKFPAVNPHEKPFENYAADENRKQIEQVVASALNQVLSRSPTSNKQVLPTPRSPIEDLIEKINIQHKEQDLKNTEHKHFNSLISKMANKQTVSRQPETSQSDILKWFSAKSTVASNNDISSEIKFMEMRRPENKLY